MEEVLAVAVAAVVVEEAEIVVEVLVLLQVPDRMVSSESFDLVVHDTSAVGPFQTVAWVVLQEFPVVDQVVPGSILEVVPVEDVLNLG